MINLFSELGDDDADLEAQIARELEDIGGDGDEDIDIDDLSDV